MYEKNVEQNRLQFNCMLTLFAKNWFFGQHRVVILFMSFVDLAYTPFLVQISYKHSLF